MFKANPLTQNPAPLSNMKTIHFYETSYKYQSRLDDMQSAKTITCIYTKFKLFSFAKNGVHLLFENL